MRKQIMRGLFAAILSAQLLTNVADAQVNQPLPFAPIDAVTECEPTMRAKWTRATRAITVFTPCDCRVVLAEFGVDGRMVRVRIEETVGCNCVFSDDVEGRSVKLFALDETGAPVCPAMDLTSFCAWYNK